MLSDSCNASAPSLIRKLFDTTSGIALPGSLGSEQTGVRSDFHSFLVLAKSSNLGDAHLDGLQGSLISPSHATETMPIEAMPSAFHEFSDEIR